MGDQPNRFIPTIRTGKTIALLSLSGLIVFAIAGACSPFSDSGGENPDSSLDTGREVTVATFTPTTEGETSEFVITQEARQTAAAVTATAIATNPDAAGTQAAGIGSPPPVPSNFPTVPEEDALAPPAAFLHLGEEQIDSTYGSFQWIFEDEAQTGARVTTPFITVTEHGLTVPSNSELTLTMEDPGIAGPPVEVKVTIYDFESTATIPYDESGTILSDRPTFVPRADVTKHLDLTLDLDNMIVPINLAPTQYIVYVQARWPDHPELPGQPIFVNYAFNIFVE